MSFEPDVHDLKAKDRASHLIVLAAVVVFLVGSMAVLAYYASTSKVAIWRPFMILV